MRGVREPGRLVIGLALLLTGCNSDKPEPAVVDLPAAGYRLTVTRLATHPFLARFRLILHIERPSGCPATVELFPDTGYVGRRNLYHHPSGSLLVLGQYDARVIESEACVIRLVEFRSLEPGATFLGSFDVDHEKRWRYLPASARAERPFDIR